MSPPDVDPRKPADKPENKPESPVDAAAFRLLSEAQTKRPGMLSLAPAGFTSSQTLLDASKPIEGPLIRSGYGIVDAPANFLQGGAIAVKDMVGGTLHSIARPLETLEGLGNLGGAVIEKPSIVWDGVSNFGGKLVSGDLAKAGDAWGKLTTNVVALGVGLRGVGGHAEAVQGATSLENAALKSRNMLSSAAEGSLLKPNALLAAETGAVTRVTTLARPTSAVGTNLASRLEGAGAKVCEVPKIPQGARPLNTTGTCTLPGEGVNVFKPVNVGGNGLATELGGGGLRPGALAGDLTGANASRASELVALRPRVGTVVGDLADDATRLKNMTGGAQRPVLEVPGVKPNLELNPVPRPGNLRSVPDLPEARLTGRPRLDVVPEGTPRPGGTRPLVDVVPENAATPKPGTTRPGGVDVVPENAATPKPGTTRPGGVDVVPENAATPKPGTTRPGGVDVVPENAATPKPGTTRPGGVDVVPE
ncbi:MAG: hypothetical protein K2W95_30580, partial [Candidatus Obscuribacterales bacterium]|nr:hypothetical protein [Candidatus Obscuribacterales bacterium]